MLGFLKSKTGGKLIDNISSCIDKSFYTKQEKAETHKKLLSIQLEALKIRSNLSSRTRRWLAWGTFSVFLFFVLLGGILTAFKMDQGSDVIRLLEETALGELAMMVGGVYFGSYGIGNIIKSGKK